jgi:small GTP-binding protein
MREISCKICIFGDMAVGKTTIIHRFTTGEFIEDYQGTLGAGFSEYEIEGKKIDSKYEGCKIHLNIYDIAAQATFNYLLDMYTSGLHGYFLAFAVDNPTSLDNLEEWRKKIIKLNPETKNIPFLIIATKDDLESKIAKGKIDEVAKKLGAEIIMTSSKNEKNVADVFVNLTKKILAEFDSF